MQLVSVTGEKTVLDDAPVFRVIGSDDLTAPRPDCVRPRDPPRDHRGHQCAVEWAVPRCGGLTRSGTTGSFPSLIMTGADKQQSNNGSPA
jgi:hypothetical protein